MLVSSKIITNTNGGFDVNARVDLTAMYEILGARKLDSEPASDPVLADDLTLGEMMRIANYSEIAKSAGRHMVFAITPMYYISRGPYGFSTRNVYTMVTSEPGPMPSGSDADLALATIIGFLDDTPSVERVGRRWRFRTEKRNRSNTSGYTTYSAKFTAGGSVGASRHGEIRSRAGERIRGATIECRDVARHIENNEPTVRFERIYVGTFDQRNA